MTYCEFLTGRAGSGKSFEIARRVRENPNYGIIGATTGVAAINLNTVTVNSILGYFDTESLERCYAQGWLQKRIAQVGKKYQHLVIDEAPMLDAKALDILYRAITDHNQKRSTNRPLGLVLVGDFCQLPPVEGDWAFKAECWGEFENNTIRLETNWRQSDGRFLDALNDFRRGDGASGVGNLQSAGVSFSSLRDMHYDGTTILGDNASVDRHNWASYVALKSDKPEITIRSRRWGKERAEWAPLVRGRKNPYFPVESQFKIGAYVMILANDSPQFRYVNGDCGHILDYDDSTRRFAIELVRNKQVVYVGPIQRFNTTHREPDEIQSVADLQHVYCQCKDTPEDRIQVDLSSGRAVERVRSRKVSTAPWGTISYHCLQEAFIVGAIEYMPIRLAYAATVHKTQGLSLDRIQMDVAGHMFSRPAMVYVAASRCRTPEGLRIVGSPELLAKRCSIDPEVERWL